MNCAHKIEDFANAGPALSCLNAGLLQACFQLLCLHVPAMQLSTLLLTTPWLWFPSRILSWLPEPALAHRKQSRIDEQGMRICSASGSHAKFILLRMFLLCLRKCHVSMAIFYHHKSGGLFLQHCPSGLCSAGYAPRRRGEPDKLGSLLGLQKLNFEQQFWLFGCPCARSVTDLIYDGYLFLLGLIKAP